MRQLRISFVATAVMLAVALSALPAAARDQALSAAWPGPRAIDLTLPREASYLTSEGKVRVVGYNDMDEMLPALAARFAALHPGIAFDFQLEGTRTAPPALTDGSSAFAPMGAVFTTADQAEYRRRWRAEPLAVRIAHASLQPGAITSPLGIFVHRDNPLRQIRLADARRIFVRDAERPAFSDWGPLGLGRPWAGRPIHPVGMGPTTALGLFLLEGPLRGPGFVASYDGRPQSREVVAAVAADPLAIGLANLSNANPMIRALAIVDARGRVSTPSEAEVRRGRYPLDRHLLIYVRRDRSGRIGPLAKAFPALALSCEGQAIIGAGTRGYLPLNDREVSRERKAAGIRGYSVAGSTSALSMKRLV